MPVSPRFVLHLPRLCLAANWASCHPHSCFFTSGARRQSWNSPIGNGTHSCVPGFLGKSCSLEVLRQRDWDRTDKEGQRSGRSRGRHTSGPSVRVALRIPKLMPQNGPEDHYWENCLLSQKPGGFTLLAVSPQRRGGFRKQIGPRPV